jgi:hypothetical protein
MFKDNLFSSTLHVAISWAMMIWRMPLMYLGPYLSSLLS